MRYFVVGSGMHATLVKEYVEESGKKVDAFVVEKEYVDNQSKGDSPIISIEDLLERYPQNDCGLFMGIGYKQMGEIRKRLFERLKNLGYIFENYIHPSCVLPSDLDIGEGNTLLESVIIEKRCKIGNANLLYAGVVIGHDSHIENYITMSIKSSCMGEVSIKDNCFLGGGSAVKNKVTLNDHVLLGATALAYKDIPAYAVVKPPRSDIDTSVNSIQYF